MFYFKFKLQEIKFVFQLDKKGKYHSWRKRFIGVLISGSTSSQLNNGDDDDDDDDDDDGAKTVVLV